MATWSCDRRHRRRLSAESLEDRRLLAAAILEHDNTAYIFSDVVSSAQRYDIENEQWLSTLTLDGTGGAPTTAHVDDDGIYVAFDKAIYRYDLNGANAQHLYNAPTSVVAIHSDGNLLLINHSSGLYTRATSIEKTNNAIISTVNDYLDQIYGSSISPLHNRIYGRTSGLSPSDITYLQYDDSGQFSTNRGSPYHGDYPGASKTWVFPDQSAVVDSSGTVYSTESLTRLASFGTRIDDIDFHGADIPIVLTGSSISSFSNSILPAGQAQLTSDADKIFVNQSNVLAFIPNGSSPQGYDVQTVGLDQLNAPTPGEPVDPVGLPYQPDKIETSADGSLLIFSPAHRSVFRWDPQSAQYVESIPLIGAPSFMAYSSDNHTIYLAYASGLIRQISLDDPLREERNFAVLPQGPSGLATAGEFVFAVDPSGAWNTHYTFSPSGILISAVDWNRYSTEFIWNDVTRRIYFFRDGTSPNDLHSELIGVNGAIVSSNETPLHGGPFRHPIHVSPDGSYVVLGSGAMFHATTLAELNTSLPITLIDAAWLDDQLFSLRTIGGVSQIHAWDGPTFAQGKVRQSQNDAIALIGIPDALVYIESDSGGVPVFTLLDADLELTSAKPRPQIQWDTPAPISHGTPLTETELSATASVPGTFVYSPPLGTVLEPGDGQVLELVFTPDDLDTYQSTRASVIIDVLGFDYGDAPEGTVSGFQASYPTMLAVDGARHITGGVRLGSSRSIDLDGDGTTLAASHGDDDGVSVVTTVFALSEASSQASLVVTPSQAAKIDAWIDFNRDGDWLDSGEQILTSADVIEGEQLLLFNVPAGAQPGQTAMRIRASDGGNLSPSGPAPDGEVEDYWIELQVASAGFSLDASLFDSEISFVNSGSQILVRHENDLIASFPAMVFGVVHVQQGNEDSVTEVPIDLTGAFQLSGNAGEGEDTVVFEGSQQSLDLVEMQADQLAGIEIIDVRGQGPNSVHLTHAAVRSVTDHREVLLLVHGADDTIDIGSGWSAEIPVQSEGKAVHVLKHDSTALRIINETPHRNPIDPYDTNRSSVVSALDALMVINWIGRKGDDAELTLENSGGFYLDVSGDGRATPLDALRIINELARQLAATQGGSATNASSAQDEVMRAWPTGQTVSAVPTMASSSSSDDDDTLLPQLF